MGGVMRKIKFRAWDKGKKRFHYFNGIFNEMPYKEMSTFPQYESFKKPLALGDLQQFAGLHDKNDKEIYEGDFVTNDPDRMDRGIVEYGSGMFVWYDGIQEEIPLSYHIDDLEVIGNIYENPELLEKNLEE
jgi:uncharacterized phage protein (TIGR01671 family)